MTTGIDVLLSVKYFTKRAFSVVYLRCMGYHVVVQNFGAASGEDKGGCWPHLEVQSLIAVASAGTHGAEPASHTSRHGTSARKWDKLPVKVTGKNWGGHGVH
jgi:hypothetical protein